MKALVTGARGTVGSALCQRLQARGDIAVGWDRQRAPAGDWEASARLVREEAPDLLFHIALPSQPSGRDNEGWLVNEKWTADLAYLAHERGIPFVYASTVMVFSSRARGPFTPEMTPDETEGYGLSKLRGEEAARASNPAPRIGRFGWQIGREPVGNNMLEKLERQHREEGVVTASTRWLPATSFLEDTADALIALATMAPGTYHLNSNPEWNFFEVVSALNVLHGGRWTVRPTEDFVYDQRMIDPRITLPSLAERLPALRR